MSETEALYSEFWEIFRESIEPDDLHLSRSFRTVHRNLGYIEFPKLFGESFRLRGTLSVQSGAKNLLNGTRIRAEFKTGCKLGVAFVRDGLGDGRHETLNGSIARWQVTTDADAKIELEWQGADLRNRAFWPAHQLWLRSALHELADTYENEVLRYEDLHA